MTQSVPIIAAKAPTKVDMEGLAALGRYSGFACADGAQTASG